MLLKYDSCDNGGIPVNTKKCQKTNYKSSVSLRSLSRLHLTDQHLTITLFFQLCLLDVIKLKQQPCVNLCENGKIMKILIF